jgi:hypothetical protein
MGTLTMGTLTMGTLTMGYTFYGYTHYGYLVLTMANRVVELDLGAGAVRVGHILPQQ